MPEARVGGARLHYLDEGTGDPALVLLHAFPLRAAMWAPQLDTLAPLTRVVAPDLVGFGGSDAPEDPAAYSVEGWADQVAGLCDHLGLDRVVVAGLSMGGYAALAFLRRHPHRLAGLALADTRPGADAPEVAERRRRQIDQIRRDGTQGVIETLLAGLLGDHTRRHRPEVVATARSLMDSAPAGLVGALDAMIRRPDAGADLGRVAVPATVVVGDQDTLSPIEVARGMHERTPGAHLAVIPGAGHLSSLEAPGPFSAALANLVARSRRPGGHH